MSDELMRELRRLEKTQEIRVPLSSDNEGYLDRECPSAECRFAFKIHEDAWREKVRGEEVFWPFCGYTAHSRKWLTQEQFAHEKQATIAHIQRDPDKAVA